MKNLTNFLKTQYINTSISFFIRENEFKELKQSNNEKKEEKSIVEDPVSDAYNKLILKQDEKYDELPNARKKEFYSKYSISALFLSAYNYSFFIPPLHHK